MWALNRRNDLPQGLGRRCRRLPRSGPLVIAPHVGASGDGSSASPSPGCAAAPSRPSSSVPLTAPGCAGLPRDSLCAIDAVEQLSRFSWSRSTSGGSGTIRKGAAMSYDQVARQVGDAPPLLHAGTSSTAEVLARSGFATRAELGQHFLRSADTVRRLLDCADLTSAPQVLEVGAGLGTLSAAVAASGCQIWAVERDARLGGILQDRLRPFGQWARVTINDVRRVDLDGGLDQGSVLVSILPFDWELSAALASHVFTATRKVSRGVVVVPRRTLEARSAAGADDGVLWEEIDCISRGEFWPAAPGTLRVVAIRRRR
ncbi:rRNA adenine N-6-methyltransferase family protein [Streptomyces mirabilis]|uniref:rRNA adenine N-6-methyltransferase family protein n=1 Tax=Streptomyces mirabilis TaxID=68239 RepID=UPI0036915498